MPEPTKIPRAFAASGDKNSIPDSSGSPGFASWQEGFPAITSEPFAQGGIAPKRADFNGIFNALSLATLWQQQGGFYAYDATTDYEVGNVVLYSGDLYKCLSANGPSSAVKAPTDATVWAKVILTTATTSAAGYMSAADKSALDDVPSTYLPLSGGTLTGTLYTKDIYIDNAAIRAYTDAQNLNIYGGTGYLHGAYIVLNGKDSSSNPGRFYIRADNGVTSKVLIGETDGTLTWDGKSIFNNGAFNAMYFSQTSGSYTAPYTGVYRITLKGGGGGGGPCSDAYKGGGGGGGEGGALVFYETLIKNQAYPYTIGAGGSAAPNTTDSNPHLGTNGGDSSFNNKYFVGGGKGGGNSYYAFAGGAGGTYQAYPSGAVVHLIPGQRGSSGTLSSSGYGGSHAVGGGSPASYGAGGEGACFSGGNPSQGASGGDGYILVEYAG